MAIDKGLYQAPKGIQELADNMEPDITVEVEDPEAVHINADGFELDIEKMDEEDGSPEFNANLAEDMDCLLYTSPSPRD